MAEPPSAGPNGSVSSPNALNGAVVDAKIGEKMAKWTLADDEVMFDVLLDAKARAGISHNGFSRDTWQEVADAVTRCTTVGGKKDIENCKSRWQRLRKDYKAIRWIKDQPGFTWDAENFVLLAGEESWEIWLGEHPEHQKYRVFRFPQYDALATIADDDLPPGHLPIRPRIRPGGMFSHITGSSAPTFSHSPFSSIQSTVPYTPSHIIQQPPSVVQPVVQYVDPSIPGPSSRPSNRITSPTSDEEVEESMGENGRDDSSSRLASRHHRKRRRISSPEFTDGQRTGRASMRFDELFSKPLAEALFSLKETADDYVTLLRGQRSTDVHDESSILSLSRDRRSAAIHLLLETERTGSFDGEEQESEREGLTDEDIARLIHIFQRDLVSANTYVQLVRKGASVSGIRKKWVEQLLSNG